MKHLGDITKIDGHKVPIVDVVTGGSPCQDLSVAGKRAGLAGERSGLFMEQMRIIKEMREEDERRSGRTGFLIRPRWLIWENVPGAFSSGTPKGADFQAVLQEICRVVCKEAPPVPIPEKGWPTAGCLSGVGDSGCTFSVAWRVHDAQFWGVAQRRKRVSVVADFGGLAAPEVLFEREGLSGHSESRGEKGQGASAGTESGAGVAGRCLNGWDVQSKHIQPEDGIADALYAGECRGGGGESYTLKVRGGVDVDSHGRKAGKGALVQKEMSGTLGVSQDQTLIQTAYGIGAYNSEGMKSDNPNSGVYEADTARTLDLNGGSPACNQGGVAVVEKTFALEGNGQRDSHKGDGYAESDTMYTLNTVEQHGVCAVDVYNQTVEGDVAPTVTAAAGGTNTSGPKVMTAGFKAGQGANAGGIGYQKECAPTLSSAPSGTNTVPTVMIQEEEEEFDWL